MKTFNQNKKLRIFFYIISLCYISVSGLRAQVTIGSGLEPNVGSLLQLKENDSAPGGENSHKGFNLPRVNITDGNNLYPMFLKNPENPALGPTDEYAANKDAIDKTHTGLLVYNINETAGFLKGLYIWKGDHWVYSDGISPWYAVDTQTSADHNTDEVYLNGTVTIGKSVTEEENAQGALLQLAENVKATKSLKPQHNAYRGLALPRVRLSNKNELYPMFLTNPELPYNETVGVGDPKYNAEKAEYKNGKNNLKASHVGLMVYNMAEDNNNDLCLGINQWDGEQWNCLANKPSNAQFSIDCATGIQVLGEYGDNVALNSSNYLRVFVNVTRIGAYSISAGFADDSPQGDNGYFFELAGTFLATGTFWITIPGTGQPKVHTQGTNLLDTGQPGSDDTPDKFVLNSSGGGENCQFLVNVRSTAARPEFTIDCKSATVVGKYFEDVALTTEHQIKVTLRDIPPTAYGAVAKLETNTIDGFSFKGEAVLSSPIQEIIMYGTGIPRMLEDKIFTITSNSESSTASCSATVYMLIPPKRLMTMGINSVYGYNPGNVDVYRSPINTTNAMLTDSDNFGYNQWSIVKFAGFKNAGSSHTSNEVADLDTWSDDDRDIISLTLTGWRDSSGTGLAQYLMGNNGHRKIDIFIIGWTGGTNGDVAYDWWRNGDAGDKARCEALAAFVKAGGILMVMSEQPNSNANFFNLLFDNPSPAIGSALGRGPGTNYTLGFNANNTPANMRAYYCNDSDPILAGPFANILGRSWGEDASTTMYITNLPLDEVTIYSGARSINDTFTTTGAPSAEAVTIFRHNDYPFIFVGDGGFNSAENRTYQAVSDDVCPFQLAPKTINGRVYNYYPHYRSNFGDPGNRADNTIFLANAFAWCIYKAEEYRRNNK